MQTISLATDLPAPADRVWDALRQPAAFLYVCRGLLGMPALAGRIDELREGETGSGWLFLAHVVPLHRHTIQVISVDATTRTIRTEERGGVLRRWEHTLAVEPTGPATSRYRDTVTLDAGRLTPAMAVVGGLLYRYRQARWRRLARRHLQPI